MLKQISLSIFFFGIIIVNTNAQILMSKAAKSIKKANELLEKKNYEEAITYFDLALSESKGSQDYEIYYSKGYCYYQLLKYEKAIEQFNYALIKINDKQVLALKTEDYVYNSLQYRAQSNEILKNHQSALKDWQILTTIINNLVLKSKAYEHLAKNVFEINNIENQDKAELLILKAIEINPSNVSALSFQAELALKERDYEEASIALNKAIQIETNLFEKAKYQSQLALCRYRLGNKDEALKIFKSSIEIAPESTKWKIYQQHANLIIIHYLYDSTILNQAKIWANRASILSEDCTNNITLAYILALNNDLLNAKDILKQIPNCKFPLLRTTSDSLTNWINELLKVATLKSKTKIFNNLEWYYWGNLKGGLADGDGKAISNNFLFEVKDARFLKGEIISGTLISLYDGWKYTGNFKNQQLNGLGKIIYSNGDIYQGDFVQNQPNGKGKWLYNNGSNYEGNFVNGQPDGFGIFKGNDNTSYEGFFKTGKFNGKGKITINGVQENVEFTNGERTDAAYLLKKKEQVVALENIKKEKEAEALKQLREKELAKAEKRKLTGKILGKSLLIAGGALALTQSVNSGNLSISDATDLGTALLKDVLTDGKGNVLTSSLSEKSNLLNNNLLNYGNTPINNTTLNNNTPSNNTESINNVKSSSNTLSNITTSNNSASNSNSSSPSVGKSNTPESGSDCNCANSSEPQKYKKLVDQKIDVQTNSMCALLALYECLEKCPTTKASKDALRDAIKRAKANIETMTNGRGCR